MPGNFTYRALALGALLSLAINVFFAYARLAMATAGMSSDYITAGAVFLFFLVVAFFNPALKLIRRAWGFNRSELIIIYAMMIIGSAIPTWGFTGNLIAIVAQYLLLCHLREQLVGAAASLRPRVDGAARPGRDQVLL